MSSASSCTIVVVVSNILHLLNTRGYLNRHPDNGENSVGGGGVHIGGEIEDISGRLHIGSHI